MKFNKISLDESLFDDFDTPFEVTSSTGWSPVKDIVGSSFRKKSHPSFSYYDDDFISPDYLPDMNDIPEGPEEGSDTGVADLLINAINEEWATIRQYNSLVATLRAEAVNNPIYTSFVDVINDVVNEENKHVGQLQELLKQISPNVDSIEKGQQEGHSQLNLTNGVLMVKSWEDEPKTSSSNNIPNQVDDTCTISDVDDEM